MGGPGDGGGATLHFSGTGLPRAGGSQWRSEGRRGGCRAVKESLSTHGFVVVPAAGGAPASAAVPGARRASRLCHAWAPPLPAPAAPAADAGRAARQCCTRWQGEHTQKQPSARAPAAGCAAGTRPSPTAQAHLGFIPCRPVRRLLMCCPRRRQADAPFCPGSHNELG